MCTDCGVSQLCVPKYVIRGMVFENFKEGIRVTDGQCSMPISQRESGCGKADEALADGQCSLPTAQRATAVSNLNPAPFTFVLPASTAPQLADFGMSSLKNSSFLTLKTQIGTTGERMGRISRMGCMG